MNDIKNEIPPILNTPDEIAGRVVEMMYESHQQTMVNSPEMFPVDLRRLIHDAICLAVDRDREERLDYENTERKRKQRENGFLDMWNMSRN